MRATVEQERAVSEKYLKRISLENLKRFLAELSELGRRDGREKNKKPRIAAGRRRARSYGSWRHMMNTGIPGGIDMNPFTPF